MSQKRNEIVKVQALMRVSPANQQLVKANRMLLGFVFFLMGVVVVLGLFFIPSPDAAKVTQAQAVASAAEGMNPAISAEVNNLKGQMIGLVSGSIESKLRVLEESVKSGSVDSSLGAIADLKNDVKVLRDYSEPAQKTDSVPAVANQDLAREVSHLRKLIYVTLASCGLMFAATAGVWLRQKRLPYDEIKRFLNIRK